MELFEKITRTKVRFPSTRGDMTVENLWDMPLSAKNGFDLDTVAKAVNADLKAQAEESFVETSANPRKAVLQLQLDVLKHIITVKQAENAAARAASDNAAKRNKLMEILGKKQDEALESLTPDQLAAEIAKLG